MIDPKSIFLPGDSWLFIIESTFSISIELFISCLAVKRQTDKDQSLSDLDMHPRIMWLFYFSPSVYLWKTEGSKILFSSYLPLPHSTPQKSDEAEFFPCVNHAKREDVFIGKPCSLGHLVTDGPCRATGLSHQSCPRDRDCVYNNRWAQATSKHLINLEKTWWNSFEGIAVFVAQGLKYYRASD